MAGVCRISLAYSGFTLNRAHCGPHERRQDAVVSTGTARRDVNRLTVLLIDAVACSSWPDTLRAAKFASKQLHQVSTPNAEAPHRGCR
jgi:hypothetical protein